MGVIAVFCLLSVLGGATIVRSSLHTETNRLVEVFRYLHDVRESQQCYYAIHGHYAEELSQLDLSRPAPAHFSIGGIEVSGSDHEVPHWQLTLLRAGISPLCGSYVITFGNEGMIYTDSLMVETCVLSIAESRSQNDGTTLARLEH